MEKLSHFKYKTICFFIFKFYKRVINIHYYEDKWILFVASEDGYGYIPVSFLEGQIKLFNGFTKWLDFNFDKNNTIFITGWNLIAI